MHLLIMALAFARRSYKNDEWDFFLPMTGSHGTVSRSTSVSGTMSTATCGTATSLAPITMDQFALGSGDRWLDLRLTKPIQLRGAKRAELFFEGYNVLNAKNHEPPSGVMTSSSFASLQSARDARPLQFHRDRAD
jgi:hypothetical protein